MRTRRLPFYECRQGIFEIDEFDCGSIFVVVGDERALVLDTGTGIGDLRWVIENRITDKPYDVVITHNHGDHIGGAGFFDTVWVHAKDMDWDNGKVVPKLDFRKRYARLISRREGKHYIYDVDRDIVEWEKTPEKKELKDGQVFDLGGRTVTIYHCPGHTPGQCVAIDDLTGTLLCSDACNNNLLLGKGDAKSDLEAIENAYRSLKRIWDMRDRYDEAYNFHHDYRGFGSPLANNVLPNAVECLKSLLEGTAEIKMVPDALSETGAEKMVAVYDNVQITYMGGDISKLC